jgi:hypothetical protein
MRRLEVGGHHLGQLQNINTVDPGMPLSGVFVQMRELLPPRHFRI